MGKSINWRKIFGSQEIGYFKQVAEFLSAEADRQQIALDQKETEWKKMPYGGEEYQGMTAKDHAVEALQNSFYETEKIQQIMFRSFLLAIFAFIENDLRDLCERAQIVYQQKFSVDELKHQGFRACTNYLNRLMSSGFMSKDRDLEACIALRNVLAHGKHKVSKEEQKKVQDVCKETVFNITFDNDTFIVSKENINQAINFAERVWNEITGKWDLEAQPST